jgi:hypothetical protein
MKGFIVAILMASTAIAAADRISLSLFNLIAKLIIDSTGQFSSALQVEAMVILSSFPSHIRYVSIRTLSGI